MAFCLKHRRKKYGESIETQKGRKKEIRNIETVRVSENTRRRKRVRWELKCVPSLMCAAKTSERKPGTRTFPHVCCQDKWAKARYSYLPSCVLPRQVSESQVLVPSLMCAAKTSERKPGTRTFPHEGLPRQVSESQVLVPSLMRACQDKWAKARYSYLPSWGPAKTSERKPGTRIFPHEGLPRQVSESQVLVPSLMRACQDKWANARYSYLPSWGPARQVSESQVLLPSLMRACQDKWAKARYSYLPSWGPAKTIERKPGTRTFPHECLPRQVSESQVLLPSLRACQDKWAARYSYLPSWGPAKTIGTHLPSCVLPRQESESQVLLQGLPRQVSESQVLLPSLMRACQDKWAKARYSYLPSWGPAKTSERKPGTPTFPHEGLPRQVSESQVLVPSLMCAAKTRERKPGTPTFPHEGLPRQLSESQVLVPSLMRACQDKWAKARYSYLPSWGPAKTIERKPGTRTFPHVCCQDKRAKARYSYLPSCVLPRQESESQVLVPSLMCAAKTSERKTGTRTFPHVCCQDKRAKARYSYLPSWGPAKTRERKPGTRTFPHEGLPRQESESQVLVPSLMCAAKTRERKPGTPTFPHEGLPRQESESQVLVPSLMCAAKTRERKPGTPTFPHEGLPRQESESQVLVPSLMCAAKTSERKPGTRTFPHVCCQDKWAKARYSYLPSCVLPRQESESQVLVPSKNWKTGHLCRSNQSKNKLRPKKKLWY